MNPTLSSDPPRYSPQELPVVLNWVRNAADLLTPAHLALPEEIRRAPLLRQPAPLDARLPRRVGLQFETMIDLYLQSIPGVQKIQRNLQIIENGITLGELDFLFEYQGQPIHLETAVKFYLKLGRDEGLADWVGPNLKDNLDKKWRRMLGHQTRIAQSDACRQMLGMDRDHSITPALWVKGWLFYHPTEGRSVNYPDPVNPDHARGWWIRRAEMEHYLGQFGRAFVLPGKPNWLTPASLFRGRELNLSELKRGLTRLQQPQHIWVVTGTGPSRQILSRGFIVPDDWAETV